MASNMYDLHYSKRKDITSPQFKIWSYDRIPDILSKLTLSARQVSHKFGYEVGQTSSVGEATKHIIPLYNPNTAEKQLDVWVYPSGSKKLDVQTPTGESRLMVCQFATVHLMQSAAEFEQTWINEHDVVTDLSELTTQFYCEMLRANSELTYRRPKSMRDSLILQGEPVRDDAGLYNTGAIQGIRESGKYVHIVTVQKPFVAQTAFEKLAQDYLTQTGFEVRENKSSSDPSVRMFDIYQPTQFGLLEPIKREDPIECGDVDGFEPLPFDVPVSSKAVNRIIDGAHKAASHTKVGYVVSKQKQIDAGATDYSITFEIMPRHAKDISNRLPLAHNSLRGPIAKNEVLETHLRQNFAQYVRDHQDVFTRPIVIDTSAKVDDLPF